MERFINFSKESKQKIVLFRNFDLKTALKMRPNLGRIFNACHYLRPNAFSSL